MRIHTCRAAILAVGAVCILFIGCENSIEPLAEDADSFVFLNGFLDSAADSQFVRLSGLRPSILGEPRDLSDATVTTIDLTNGMTVPWRDSLVVLDDGTDGHVYIGLFRPEEGHAYEFNVKPPDREAATATTTIPEKPDIQVAEPSGDLVVFTQDVTIVGVFGAPAQLGVRYDVVIPETGEVRTFTIDYGDNGRVAGQGWLFEVFLFRDQQIISFQLGREPGAPKLGLANVAAQIVLNSREWDDQFDPINLSLANGFFGSVGRFDLDWRLDPDAVIKIGFADEQDRVLGKREDLFQAQAVLFR